eukprot:COSAG02_NODE_41280_length_396_cov_0.703704_1_plen_50_part_01
MGAWIPANDEFVFPTTILNSQVSNLNSKRKLDELQMALGSEFLVQYGKVK